MAGTSLRYDYDPDLVRELLGHLVPSNMLLVVITRDFKGKTDKVGARGGGTQLECEGRGRTCCVCCFGFGRPSKFLCDVVRMPTPDHDAETALDAQVLSKQQKKALYRCCRSLVLLCYMYEYMERMGRGKEYSVQRMTVVDLRLGFGLFHRARFTAKGKHHFVFRFLPSVFEVQGSVTNGRLRAVR